MHAQTCMYMYVWSLALRALSEVAPSVPGEMLRVTANRLPCIVGRLSYVFVVGFLLFSTLFQNVAIILPEFTGGSPEFHWM